MPQISIDFGSVEDSFSPIEPGTYPVIVEQVEMRMGKTSNQPYLNWEFTVTEGEFEGRKLWYTTSLQPNALFNLKGLLSTLGVLEDQMSIDIDEGSNLMMYPEVSGIAAQAVVVADVYNGKPTSRVDAIVGMDAPIGQASAIATGKKPVNNTPGKLKLK